MDSPAYNRQHLLTEFSGLRQCAPKGVYFTLSPNDQSIWWGAIFPRDGPYAGIPLKLCLSFPGGYPHVPPQVVFIQPPPHPLLTPLNRPPGLPRTGSSDVFSSFLPGAFSLKHGFPEWFSSRSVSKGFKPMGLPSGPGAVEVIWYIKSAFSEKVLDSIPKSLALDERTWTKWNEDKDKFVESLERFKESEDVFSAWKGGNAIAEDDIPMRFWDIDEDALEAIKENIQRSITPADDLLSDTSNSLIPRIH